MYKYLIFLISIVVHLPIQAQELVVEALERCAEPMVTSMQQKDLNGNICALVKVQLPIIGCKFDGNVVATKFEISEYWVYLTSGSKQINIKCPNKKTCSVVFGQYGVDKLEGKGIYLLNLQGWNNNNTNTIDTSTGKSSEESINCMRLIANQVISLGATEIGPFKNGIAPIKKDSKYAFIDKFGKQLTAFAFDSYLVDHYLPVKKGWIVKKGDLYGVVNSTGKLTVPCVYRNINIVDDLAECTSNIKIEKGGAIIASSFSKAKYDIINIENGELIKKGVAFNVARDIVEGNNNTYPQLKGYNQFVNKDGKKAFPGKFEYAYRFSENLACVRTKQDGWIIIDQNGDQLGALPPGSFPYYGNNGIYSDGCFYEGLLAIEKNQKVGYINKYGKIIIPLIYSEGRSFSEGMAAVATGNRWGNDFKMFYINKQGEISIEPTDNLFSLGEFKNGIAIGVLRGYVLKGDPYPQLLYNKDGHVLLQGTTHSLNRLVWYGSDCFKYNLFPIKKSTENGSAYVYVNHDYKEIGEEFSYAEIFMDEFTSVVTKDGRSGIIDRYGNVVLLDSEDLVLAKHYD